MIPKTIHYIWLSGDEKPDLVRRCMDSWRKNCPDYEIKEWNTGNLDVAMNRFVRDTYAIRHWAAVSDFFRLWILYNYGGIYLDSDVEVIKPFDPLLNDGAFVGFEHNPQNLSRIEAAVIGAEAGLPVLAEILKEFDVDYTVAWVNDMQMNFPIIPEIMMKVLQAHGLRAVNEKQSAGGFQVYPSDYFCCKHNVKLTITVTPNSYSVHHFVTAWLGKKNTILRRYIAKYGRFYKPMLILTKPVFSFKLLLAKRKRRAEGRQNKKRDGN
jgi:hypothetical protein